MPRSQRPELTILLALNEALEQTRGRRPARRELVKLRFFAGLTHEEAAETLGVSISNGETDLDLRQALAAIRGWLGSVLTRPLNYFEEYSQISS